MVWSARDLIILNQLDSLVTRLVNFWVKITLFGYILEFVAKDKQSTIKVEDELNRREIGILLKEFPLWIKIWLVEFGFLPLKWIRMEE